MGEFECNLKKYRQLKNLTQEQLGEKVGVRRETIMRLEAGKSDFAIRSGLVSENRMFDNKQLVELYRCMQDTPDSDCALTDAQTKLIENTQQQIESLGNIAMR